MYINQFCDNTFQNTVSKLVIRTLCLWSCTHTPPNHLPKLPYQWYFYLTPQYIEWNQRLWRPRCEHVGAHAICGSTQHVPRRLQPQTRKRPQIKSVSVIDIGLQSEMLAVVPAEQQHRWVCLSRKMHFCLDDFPGVQYWKRFNPVSPPVSFALVWQKWPHYHAVAQLP